MNINLDNVVWDHSFSMYAELINALDIFNISNKDTGMASTLTHFTTMFTFSTLWKYHRFSDVKEHWPESG